jgi:hypothetical protein
MLMLFRCSMRYRTYVFAASLTLLFAGDDTWMKLRNPRKTECGAKQCPHIDSGARRTLCAFKEPGIRL